MRALGLSSVLASIGILSFSSCFASSPDSGIEGVITISPVQPGPTRRDAPDSKPLPNIVFVVQQGEKKVSTFTTDADGKFRVSLEPGHYTVLREGPKSTIGFFGPFEIDVAAGKITNVEWQCDSGLR